MNVSAKRRPGGLIPAHAGKTGKRHWSVRCRWAHPRSRGENAAMRAHEQLNGGSSPLTRGKRRWRGCSWWGVRLIPAHAGKTAAVRRRPGRVRAHPRSRGENRSSSAPWLVGCGSSPLTRGKLTLTIPVSCVIGLIPAHAGKTRARRRGQTRWEAHPRSRGENVVQTVDGEGNLGSSPLTRGKLELRVVEPVPAGLIPAHAGKTEGVCGYRRIVGAHPRSRGENSSEAGDEKGSTGSSPLTRGKRGLGAGDTLTVGLIPAHAGKTRYVRLRGRLPGAHPRSRGENGRRRRLSLITSGSSPLTRGKRIPAQAQRPGHGLIPAHAGKTLPDLRFYRADRSDLGKP